MARYAAARTSLLEFCASVFLLQHGLGHFAALDFACENISIERWC